METFCLSSAKADISAALGEVSLFASAGWQHLRNTLGIKEEETISGLCSRNSCKAVVTAAEISMFGNPLSSYSEEYFDDDEGSPSTEDEAVVR